MNHLNGALSSWTSVLCQNTRPQPWSCRAAPSTPWLSSGQRFPGCCHTILRGVQNVPWDLIWEIRHLQKVVRQPQGGWRASMRGGQSSTWGELLTCSSILAKAGSHPVGCLCLRHKPWKAAGVFQWCQSAAFLRLSPFPEALVGGTVRVWLLDIGKQDIGTTQLKDHFPFSGLFIKVPSKSILPMTMGTDSPALSLV